MAASIGAPACVRLTAVSRISSIRVRSAARLALRTRRGARLVVRGMADAAAAGGDDPYKVLQVTPETESDRVMFAYNKLYRLAKMQNDEARMAEVEAAYNSILMMNMQRRLSGSIKADASIQNADNVSFWAEYMPWRPKWAPMEQKEMLINGALTAALCAWTLLSFDPRLRPIQIGTIAYLLTFLKKLHRLDPSPEGRDNPAKKTADNAKFFRTLSVMGGYMIAGICLATFVPIFLSQTLKFALPAWVLTKQNMLVNLFACSFMGFGSTFYR